jgi:lipoprotein-releasing system permease protein
MNKAPFEWLVGLRYTRARRRAGKNGFISFISLLSMIVIALGVAALIVVMSVMNGFQKEVRDRMLSVVSHVEVFDRYGALPDWQATAREAAHLRQIRGAAPYVAGHAMIARDDMVRGVLVRGVLPGEEGKVSNIAAMVREGSLDSLEKGGFGVVIGKELARKLKVRVNDRINVLVPRGQISAGGALPQMRQFTVKGIFDAGHFEFDSGLAVMHLEDAMTLFGLAAPNGLRFRIENMEQAPQVARDLSRTLSGELLVRDWTRQNRTWFAALQSQKTMMFLILSIIVLVAAFNMVSMLVMTVTDKQSDIAILRTQGASPRSIMKIFVVQGAMVGLFGTMIGIGAGVLLALNVEVIVPAVERLFGASFLNKEVYFISALPSDLRWGDVAAIGGVAFVLALLSTLYPSWRAGRVKPAEALRYE